MKTTRSFVGLNVATVLCGFAAFALVAILATPASAESYDAPVLWDGVPPSWSFRDTLTTGGEDRAASHGATGDIPIMGDWDGDGLDEIGLVRNQGGTLFWYLSGTDRAWEPDPVSGWVPAPFAHGGANQDIPVVGDWNGDGWDTPGLVRNNNNTFQWIL
ncbi:MAG: hypothetical protein GY953_48445, partial [bacterium]|nr:hypothetical protein [bacterium]